MKRVQNSYASTSIREVMTDHETHLCTNKWDKKMAMLGAKLKILSII
jgi:hypothetical protein